MKISKLLGILISNTLVLFSISTNAQNFEWAKSYGSARLDQGHAIATDLSGNLYVTGIFMETIDFMLPTGLISHTSAGGSDIFINKFNSTGDLIWTKSFGGAEWDYVYSISVDKFGNIYTTGDFKGSVDFDPGQGNFNLTGPTSGVGIFIHKMDAQGNFIWVKSLVPNQFSGNTINCVDDMGNLYSTGSFSGTIDFDPGTGTSNQTSAGNSDAFVHKIDSSGNFIWAKSFGGLSFENGMSIVANASGELYITGVFKGTVDFNPGSGSSSISSVGDLDIFILKLDAAGNFIWVKSFGGPSGDVSFSIFVDKSNNIYTTGYFKDSVDFDPGLGSTFLKSNGEEDVFIQKVDAFGNFLWAKTFGGRHMDIGNSINVDFSGNIYVTGDFQDTVDFDPGSGKASLSSFGHTDVFIQKIDQSGDFIWAKTFGGPKLDQGYSTIGENRSIYTTGSFLDSVDFDPQGGISNLKSKGGRDIFIQKLSQEEPIWVSKLGNEIQASAFPNPTDGIVKINYGQVLKNVEISIIDLSGEVVYFNQFNNVSSNSINFEGSGGIYFLKVRTLESNFIFKIIKH